jgi:RNA polymerase sigma-70 factor (ECF subfamily)
MIDDMTDELAAVYARALVEQPEVRVAEEDFVAALASHVTGDARVFCERTRAGELALAIAAARGSSTAIELLERQFSAMFEATCRRFAGRGHTEDDLHQILRAKLFVAEPDRPPAVAQYNGQGSLESWLRVIATRLFIDLGRRKDRARETTADPSTLDVIEPSDLELDVIKAEYRSTVAAALDEAARELDPAERHLLRQHLVAGLTIDQLAAVLGIHRATVARRIGRARDALITRTRELVTAQLALDADELADMFRLVVSKLDLSMRRLLQSRPT